MREAKALIKLFISRLSWSDKRKNFSCYSHRREANTCNTLPLNTFHYFWKTVTLKKATYFLFILSLFPLHGETQNRWTTYYSYKNCFKIVEYNQFVIGATSLGLILYDKETNSITTLNKNNGLSDYQISAIETIDEENLVLVGYENGNIDIIRNEGIENIPDLKNEQMSESKKINHFLSYNGRIFCSTDFGILELNINKEEIVSTFIIGEEASYLKVNKTLILNDTLYAATSSGLMMADMNKTLLYYNNWEYLSEDHSEFCDLIAHPSGLIAAKGKNGQNCQLILFNHQEASNLLSVEEYFNITTLNNGYVISTQDGIVFTDSQLNITTYQETILDRSGFEHHPAFRDFMVDTDQSFWIADWRKGLFLSSDGQEYQQILPSGPYSNTIFKTKKIDDELWVVPGSLGTLYDNANIPASVSILKEGEWICFDSINTPEFQNIYDLINIESNPQNSDNVFISSWGYGILEFDKDQDNNIYLKNHFTGNNDGLVESSSLSLDDQDTKIWGLTFDDEGYLFITHSNNSQAIVIYDTDDNSWHHLNYGSMALLTPIIGEITIDNYDYKWAPLLQGYKGIFVFDNNGTIDNSFDDRYRGPLTTDQDADNRNAGLLEFWDEYGEVSIYGANCIEKDKNGYLWFGTDNGVIVQYNPGNIFDEEKPSFTRIKVPRNDGSGLADYLLENEKVTAIAVDGANRKFFGTEGNGVYLISEDGTQTVNHFTKDNSPLPSDTIYNIEIDGQSGEVFFSTNKGLISYKGEAIEGKDSYSNIFVYPNPVKPEYNGLITITGLIDQTNVKITDTQGNLVYETTSLGGNALWNGKNLMGEKVKSGIYILFLASPDGMQKGTTKVAIIR